MRKNNRRFVLVTCKTCNKPFFKRSDYPKTWSGNCESCSRINRNTSIESREANRQRNLEMRSDPRYEGRWPDPPVHIGDANNKWKGGLPHCVDCGIELSSYVVKRCVPCTGKTRRGKQRPPEIGLKVSKTRLASELERRGGRPKAQVRDHKSLEYKAWRKAVFARDNYTCQFCGTRGGKIQADHIKPYSEFPELVHDLDNGRTLCEPCHRKTPTWGLTQARRMRPNTFPWNKQDRMIA